MTKKELVLRALNQEKVERVPVGFWFHFLEKPEEAAPNEVTIQQNIAGHRKFIEEFQPDFVKLMSDGYFYYPNKAIQQVEEVSDLKEFQSIGKEHSWNQGQVDLINQQTNQFVEEIAAFYNIFAPATYLKWQLPGGEKQFIDLLAEAPDLVAKALGIIADDLVNLVTRILTETAIDGIYLSVQNVQDERVSRELYQDFIQPSERKVLEAANAAGGQNILHICGYEGAKNDLHLYQDYPAAAVNWAVGPEGVSLAEGQKFFNKTVIGGFENSSQGLLYRGKPTEIQAAVNALLEEAGTTGIILGADCTVPNDIPLKNLELVRQAAKHFV